MSISIFNEANKIWKKVTDKATLSDIKLELELHRKLINFFQVGNCYYYILNLVTPSAEYISADIEQILGYQPSLFSIEFYLNKIHPNDQPNVLNFENKCAEFLQQLPADKVLKYKIRYDFRVQKSDGSYIRVLHQAIAIQTDEMGRIIATFSIDTDISHLKKEDKQVLSFIGLDGEPSYIDVDVQNIFAPTKDMLSKREKKLLILMIEGKFSKEIAEALNISPQTVETHRKNMVKKAGVKNSGELIAVAIRKGWV
jgi:DNA-binding CsgD family transcriptional regulator